MIIIIIINNNNNNNNVSSKFCFTQKRTKVMSAHSRRATSRHLKVSQVYLVYKHSMLI